MADKDRFHLFGTTPHRHEQEGLEWLRTTLPHHAPYAGWALFTFQTDEGRRYEIDAAVLTGNCLFVVELKAWTGTVVDGDIRTLVTQSPNRGREVVNHPLPLLDTKTKSLMSRVRRVARQIGGKVDQQMRQLWFEPLVWLSHAKKTKIDESHAARSHLVVGRTELSAALRHGSYPGGRLDIPDRRVSFETLKALTKVFEHKSFGLVRRDKPLTVLNGQHLLGEIIEEGDDYQDRWTQEPNDLIPPRRVRSYLVPRGDRTLRIGVERKAAREAKTLYALSDHPDILPLEGYDPAGPLGPALIFRGFAGQSLSRFMLAGSASAHSSGFSVDDKIVILRRVADALAYCQRKGMTHGALSPDAVLVRRLESKSSSRDGSTDLQVKLTRFALASTEDGSASSGTRLLTRLAGTRAACFEAPEVARGVRPHAASDLFSLGALAYYLFVEEPPAESPIALQRRLLEEEGLHITSVRDDLVLQTAAANLDDVIYNATFIDPDLRMEQSGGPLAFVDLVEAALTEPEEPEPAEEEQDPLSAKRGDVLGGLQVLGDLGSGSTARVLKVERDGRTFALKVPLSDEQDARIQRESKVLERLQEHPGMAGITRLVETRTLAGRTCLLVEYAGDSTLADELRAHGALSLDFARRWGDELLVALRCLEEAGVQHRDIKAANIGLSSWKQKTKKRLLLFDFTLSSSAPEQIGLGTPGYKDPALETRGCWDDAADRWSAAITLYEMFTGTRPPPEPVAKEPNEVAVRLEVERFDADVRDRLAPFFERCFKFDAAQRFATADDMRDAFVSAMARVPEQPAPKKNQERSSFDAKLLKNMGPGDAIAQLALSVREINALDRMGIYTLNELAQLKLNHLDGVRGVGRATARSLVVLAERVVEHLALSEGNRAPCFFKDWHGEVESLEHAVERGDLSSPLVQRLVLAGITDTSRLAAAPKTQVKNLAARARKNGAREKLADLTLWLQHLCDEDRPPETLSAAINVLAPPPRGRKGSKSRRRLRQYLGLEPVESYGRFGSAVELAKVLGVTRGLIAIELQKVRKVWASDERASVVVSRAYEALARCLDQSGGVMTLTRAADTLLVPFAPEPELNSESIRRLAEAGVRIVTEITPHDFGMTEGGRLQLQRGHTEPLIAVDRESIRLAKLLGQRADELVEHNDVLPEATAAARLRADLGEASDIEAHRRLQAQALADRTLLLLATATASTARLSARSELYRRGLEPDKAILFSAAALQGELTVDEIRRRVRARYPQSKELPKQPKLGELLKPLSLSFREGTERFVATDAPHSSVSTEVLSLRTPTSQLTQHSRTEREREEAPGLGKARVFVEEIERAVQDRGFRVLLWRGLAHGQGRSVHERTPNAELVAKALAKLIAGTHQNMDKVLLAAAEDVAQRKKLRGGLDPALKADAAGPSSSAWARLLELMRMASSRVEALALRAEQPLVLTNLGLLARYNLLDLVSRLAEQRRQGFDENGKVQPAFAVLPVYAGEGAVVQVGDDVATWLGAEAGSGLVPIPGVLSHEIVEVPSVWVERTREQC